MTEAPDEIIDTAVMHDGTEFVLVRCGEEWIVRVQGRALMSSRVPDSEEELARYALDLHPRAEDILIGGLGLGFTLRATLDIVGPSAEVTVAELVPNIVNWNQKYLGHLAEYPLDDARTRVSVGDVLDVLRENRHSFDVILLDVDNGPVALSSKKNSRIYSHSGVRACYDALRNDGVLAVWSAGPSPAFERTLRNADFEVHTVRVPAQLGSRAEHVLFMAQK
jgi:spermidine synthase